MRYTTQESNFELAPQGTFEAEITKVDEYVSQEKGNKLMVTFAFTDPDTLEERKHTEFVRPVISNGDGFRVFSDLVSLVATPEKDGEFNENDLVGKKVTIRVAHRDFNGKTYSNIQEVTPLAEKKSTK